MCDQHSAGQKQTREETESMKLISYQSLAVLKILQQGEIYRANPSISYAGEYAALIDLLGMDCACPVFCVVKWRRQNTGGKVSGLVQLQMKVPEDRVKLTEYGVWADFLYAYKFTKPGQYRVLQGDGTEITNRRYQEILTDLQTRRKLSQYHYPQALLEEIRPEWLVKYRVRK